MMLQGVYKPAVVIPEARFCEARYEPTKPAIRDPGATKRIDCIWGPGSKDCITLVASPQFMNSGMTTSSFLQNHLHRV
jgi:hypothetical protein